VAADRRCSVSPVGIPLHGEQTDDMGTNPDDGVRRLHVRVTNGQNPNQAFVPPDAPAEVRETNTSVLLLFGDRVYKVKKPVNLGFLDFRTSDARRRACQAELRLNRRLAPDVYLDVVRVSASDRRVLDHAVVMRRMPDALRLSTLVKQGEPVEDHLRGLARLLAAFHAGAVRGPRISAEGIGGLRRRWEDNLRETRGFRGTLLDADKHQRISELASAYIAGRSRLLDERVASGQVVDGHGDLIADDVFCLPDHPRVLDCLEFDARLRWVDVLDDAAFLAMDLEHLGRQDLADRFLDWYREFSASPSPASLRHHYVAYRAFVRAKVSCIRALQGEPTANDDAKSYADLALRHLERAEVRLVLVGGAPGMGKTTVGRALADRLGYVLLRSDLVRMEVQLPGSRDRYSDAARNATYRELLARARAALEHGESVIIDATWGDAEQRAAAARVAATSASRLVAVECRAPVDLAAKRAEQRLEAGTDASEAGAHVAGLLASSRDLWPEATGVDTSTSVAESLAAAAAAVGD